MGWRRGYHIGRVGDALLRERGGRSAGRTRFQLTPDSASGVRVEREICTAWRCRCRCSAGVRPRRMRRCVCPRRCRGLTESVTARAVILRLWRSSASPMRRRLRAEAAEDSDVDWRDVTNL